MSTKYELKNLATGKSTQLDSMSGTIGPDVINISHLTRDMNVFTFDPGFMATASTESKVTYIDGDAGVLLYRGYPVEQLAERSSFLEVANLLINGSLPTKAGLCAFHDSIMRHTMVNEQLLRFFQGFHHDAHPMAMVSAVVASMAAFYHDTTDINNPRHREIFAHRIIAKLPTIAAAAYKHTLGQPFIYPRNDLRYCSTAHGGANEAVLDMLDSIGSVAQIDKFLSKVKDKSDGVRLMGFGHRVYKNFDPRAKIIRGMCYRVLEKLGRTDDPLFDLALKLEEIALKDEYFVSRKLYPNVDFYSGIIYSALGIPRSMFTVMFAIARTAGWVAHWQEMVSDPNMKIGRPRQLYTGPTQRDYQPIEKR